MKNMAFNSGPLGNSLDPDTNLDDDEEKQRLISQVLELQNTLDDLSSRVDTVKVENLKLEVGEPSPGPVHRESDGASSVFQSATPKAKKK
nr:hypothetical protein BaRGS_000790 [Batillaria attramentaria]